MLGQQDNNDPRSAAASRGGVVPRKTYLRSVSWSDRSPTKPVSSRRPQLPNGNSSKARSCLPPLQPLSITRRPVDEWPTAGSDDLGVWPNPQTPRAPVAIKPLEGSNLEQQQPIREFQFKRDKLAFFDKECSRIADHIYLGSDAVAKNREILRQNGITHVLNCVGFASREYFKSDLVYKTLWLQDNPSEDITSILYDVFDYFEDVREQNGRVLVHCCQGVSRSNSLVIAYLMWREGQSFEDAFQYVKAARGVTNPNMGFACQLLQCQKRVHAVPASPNSALRMYRMAPHSPYDPLHLVPKMLSQPDIKGLDSRGAFIVHIPSKIFVWIGKKCNLAMSNQAQVAANQVIRYERAQGPILIVKEGDEPSEFWDALASEQIPRDGCQKLEPRDGEASSSGNDINIVHIRVSKKKVDVYDLDFELFYKALAGGVVPPFSASNTESETCLPARENGWGRLRKKFGSGKMKEFLISSNLKQDPVTSAAASDMIIDTCRESEQPVSLVDCPSASSPSASPLGPPDSFGCFLNSNPEKIMNSSKPELPVTAEASLPPPTPSGSDSFSCFPNSSPKFNYKSPTLSPSTSDYSSSSFTFSPSSSNWSDLSCLSSRQTSPSGLDAADPFHVNNALLADNFSSAYKEPPASPAKVVSPIFRSENASLQLKGTFPSIAERRGSNPPPRMLLPSVDESPEVPRSLVRSQSFSLIDMHDDAMGGINNEQLYDHESSGEEKMLDAGNCSLTETKEGKEPNTSCLRLTNEVEIASPVLYQWPNMKDIDLHCLGILDSRSAYNLFVPSSAFDSTSPGTLYVWLGCKFLCNEGQSELINNIGSHKVGNASWEVIGRNFLNRMNLSDNIPMEVVREGEEPEQFMNLLNGFSFQKC